MRLFSGLLSCSLACLLGLTLLAPSSSAAPAAGGSAADRADQRVIATRIIGYSVKGRPIKAYRVGDPQAARKVVFIGAMHGDERGPSRILTNLRDGNAIRGADIWVIPFLNPDGAARNTRKNARGVDLNRNFPVDWRHQTGKYYSGPRPASEPETRAVMRFLRKIDPRFMVSFHQPLYGIDTSYGKSRNLALRLAEGLQLPRKVFRCNTGCHGTMTQWFNRRRAGAALTVEYGRTVSDHQADVTGPRGLLASVWATRLRS